jgi:hypothetical protein
MRRLMDAGVIFYLPEISDYEVRRELPRAGKTRGLRWLDELGEVVTYLPLTTGIMREAAILWANVRQQGLGTAPEASLDGDVILGAQARSLDLTDCAIATTNPGHLGRYYPAVWWGDLVEA